MTELINLPLSPSAPAPVVEATGVASYAWLMIVVPLVVSLGLLLAGRVTDRWGHWVAVAASWTSFGIGFAIFLQLLGADYENSRLNLHLFSWIPAGDFNVNFGLLLDPLSLTFVMLVTFVGSLIHVYAVAYMDHDKDRRRFFAYLNLFIAAMLTLVLGNSYAVLFMGWEGVGLASYLLIGFWNFVPDYASAAKKAFVMNRVGDMGLLLAMMTMFAAYGSVDFTEVAKAAPQAGAHAATLVGLFLLVAACGKSAQFPLQAWLGDAMAGPTPVSALIHAATMVTAGVYLVVRSGAIYLEAPIATTAVAIVGAFTLLFGAIIGTAKDDMKKVLAASTMSQIGYMMLGAGLGPIGWAFAIFHLFTHGFFKALMFLGAGSVMHAMDDEINMRHFGALQKVMPITAGTFLVGWLAILGVPPFAGFWSKDKLIEHAFTANHFGNYDAPWAGWVFGIVALVGAGITAFYMSRLFFMTFYGKQRWSEAEFHPHESSPLMTIPMIILAIGATFMGIVLAWNDMFTNWLSPVFGYGEHHEPVLPIIVIQIATLAVVIIGAAVAYKMYHLEEVPVAVPAGNSLVHAARNDLYQDQLNNALFVTPTNAVMRGVVATDKHVVDGTVHGLAKLSTKLGAAVSWTQTGYIRGYAGYILAGVVVALITTLAFQF
ncbi:NADH-quinone oxidoreductase subunit L [Gleimia sp. 6138-11-ORH1]|uniref:NADH-quinone oxidoreductase subunit L n=1 Tax=Gleimia sp. 6138-11-ORH1 TaxID=2973937 RepID=UPI002168906C|nr:NADH-quinone oxidoreductase subunit L [Gleimia sp. 6138-11-ORH1]MCS4484652.1 NADH-quinone oxidoreductase subunit L [Gleimia sp. 6138-11-ORH1]